MSQNETSGIEAYRSQRLANLEELKRRGYRPFGGRFSRTGRLAEVQARFRDGAREAIAGRLVAIRPMGKSAFAHLQEGADRFQVYVRRDAVGEEAYEAFRHLDLGDFIGVEGALFTTRTGEPTLNVERWTLLCKALRPLPEKWHGLRDVDARYRQRYLDLIANADVRRLFDRRSAVVRAIRDYLHARGFTEVETPMMQPRPGGAIARPFRTHWDALNAPMFLRIAPELYLKRLLVGGYDSIFELNRNFRNEGLSRTHNPEFTMLEAYQAYSDADGMRDLVQGLILHVAQTVFGTLRVGGPDGPVDLTPPWREVRYRDLIGQTLGADWYEQPLEEARRRVQELGVAVDPGWNRVLLAHEVYEKRIEKTLIQPTFVRRLPRDLVPLARSCDDNPDEVDVYELVMGGQEISPGYSELNDPLEQRRRLEEQARGDPQALDEDFLAALEHGMPPAGGLGLGIDRLVMILTGADAIREVILFPQLKPREP